MKSSLFGPGERALALCDQVRELMRDRFFPEKHLFYEALRPNHWRQPSVMEEWKSAVRAQGLWSLSLPDSMLGADLTHLEYAHTSKEMGRSVVFKYSARAAEVGQLALIIATQGYDVTSLHSQELL